MNTAASIVIRRATLGRAMTIRTFQKSGSRPQRFRDNHVRDLPGGMANPRPALNFLNVSALFDWQIQLEKIIQEPGA
jgi:hypothetical protein